MAHLLGPVLLAAFANSPAAGQASARMAAWWALDPARTEPPATAGSLRLRTPGTGHPGAGQARSAGDWLVDQPASLRDWIRAGEPLDTAELDLHLSMLFPPVRPQGYLELRYLDAQPGEEWVGPLALITALFADAETLAVAGRGVPVRRPSAGSRRPNWAWPIRRWPRRLANWPAIGDGGGGPGSTWLPATCGRCGGCWTAGCGRRISPAADDPRRDRPGRPALVGKGAVVTTFDSRLDPAGLGEQELREHIAAELDPGPRADPVADRRGGGAGPDQPALAVDVATGLGPCAHRQPGGDLAAARRRRPGRGAYRHRPDVRRVLQRPGRPAVAAAAVPGAGHRLRPAGARRGAGRAQRHPAGRPATDPGRLRLRNGGPARAAA